MRRFCKRAISVALLFCLLIPPGFSWSVPARAGGSDDFTEDALASVALSAHFTLSEKYHTNWQRLRGPVRSLTHSVWFVRTTLVLSLKNFLLQQAQLVSALGLGWPFSNEMPEFVTIKKNGRFQIERARTAGIPVYRLRDLREQSSALINTQGNDVSSFVVKSHGQDREVMDYHGFGDIGKGGMPILFPLVGRTGYMKIKTEEAELTLEGERWVLTLGKHSIHGMVSNAPWTMAALEMDDSGVSIECSIRLDDLITQEEVRRHFGGLELIVRHTLSGDTLETNAVVFNHSKRRRSFAFALHSYFRIPKRTRRQIRVTVPADRVWRVDDEQLPADQKPAPVPLSLDLRRSPPLRTRDYDHAFTGLNYVDDDGNVNVFIQDPAQGTSLRLAMRRRGYSHVVVYTDKGDPKGKTQSIVIEPHSSVPDSFARHNSPKTRRAASLVTSPAGRSWHTKSSITARDLPRDVETRQRIAEVWTYLNELYKGNVWLKILLARGYDLEHSSIIVLAIQQMQTQFEKIVDALRRDTNGEIARFYEWEMTKPFYLTLSDRWTAALRASA